MRHFILLIFLATSIYNFSQGQTSYDSLNESEKKLRAIELIEKRLDDARQQNALNTQMIILMELISFKYNDFGDRASTYEDLISLEQLVDENPDVTAVKEIEAPLNMYMGFILRDQLKTEESLLYLKKASNMARENDQREVYGDANCHAAKVLGRLGRVDEALALFSALKSEALTSSDSLLENRVYEGIAKFYIEQGQLDSALVYAQKSIGDFIYDHQRARRLCIVSECYLLLNREIDSVIYYAEQALWIAYDQQREQEKRDAHNHLRKAYGQLGNYEQAFHHFTMYYELEQNQRSYNNAIQMWKLNEKKEAEKAALQRAFTNEQLSNQRLIIWTVSGGLLLLVIAVLFIMNQLKFIRKQNKIIKQEKQKAEESERYKELFLANVSHEIRTPIHAISGMLKILRRNAHPEFQNQFLGAMSRSTENLSKLLNDVLDLSKIASGKLTIVNEPFDLKENVSASVELLQTKAEEKGLLLEFFFLDDLPKMVKGDALRLTQILINLINNAIKFSEQGKVTISLKPETDGIRFMVADEGKGISKEDQQRIFDSFEQAGSQTIIAGGTGLGLAITKQLIELQSGEIELTSEVGKGSVFSFTLPLKELEGEYKETYVSEDELKLTGEQLRGLKILLVEDTEFNVMVAKDDLNWYFPEAIVEVASDGEEAYNMYKMNDYNLVLMDVQMPNMDGYQATKKIRELESTYKLKKKPIIAMTASLLKRDIQRCLDAGMDDFLPKPYRSDELVLKIAEKVMI
ncbi:MAG: ATP-binding protein [Bacteroidota bacterium]